MSKRITSFLAGILGAHGIMLCNLPSLHAMRLVWLQQLSVRKGSNEFKKQTKNTQQILLQKSQKILKFFEYLSLLWKSTRPDAPYIHRLFSTRHHYFWRVVPSRALKRVVNRTPIWFFAAIRVTFIFDAIPFASTFLEWYKPQELLYWVVFNDEIMTESI